MKEFHSYGRTKFPSNCKFRFSLIKPVREHITLLHLNNAIFSISQLKSDIVTERRQMKFLPRNTQNNGMTLSSKFFSDSLIPAGYIQRTSQTLINLINLVQNIIFLKLIYYIVFPLEHCIYVYLRL